jgi:hypothetical protein
MQCGEAMFPQESELRHMSILFAISTPETLGPPPAPLPHFLHLRAAATLRRGAIHVQEHMSSINAAVRLVGQFQ